jgi:hypothetical protein
LRRYKKGLLEFIFRRKNIQGELFKIEWHDFQIFASRWYSRKKFAILFLGHRLLLREWHARLFMNAGEPWESYQIAGGEFDRTIAPLHVSNEVILLKEHRVISFALLPREWKWRKTEALLHFIGGRTDASRAPRWCGLSKVQDVMRSRPDEFISYLYT